MVLSTHTWRPSPVQASFQTGPGYHIGQLGTRHASGHSEQRLETIWPQGRKSMKRYLVVIEKSTDGYGAYSPDLPGCVAVGSTQSETEEKMYEAISFHIDGLREDGLPIPESQSVAEYVVLPESA